MPLYYQDDFVTLYHGDCLTEHRGWLDADVLVTDPPYGILWDQRKGRYGNDTTVNSRKIKAAVRNDEDTNARDGALRDWGKRPAIVFGSWKRTAPAGVQHRLIWDKAGAYSGPLVSAFYSADEEIYILGTGFIKSSPPQRSVIRTTEHRSVATAQAGHPTPKPVDLMELLVARCPDGIIADPFSGSGSTLVAAKNLGRTAVGVEIEEKYCEIIAKRLSQDLLELEWTA